MKYISILLLMVAGICNAGLMEFTEIDSYGAYSGLWTVDGDSLQVTVRGVNAGDDGYVVVGEELNSSANDYYAFTIDVKNIDSNDSFDYSLVVIDEGSVIASSNIASLAPGQDTTLVLTDANGFAGIGDFAYGVKIYGGNDVFLTELSNASVPEPMTIATLAAGGLSLIRRRKK